MTTDDLKRAREVARLLDMGKIMSYESEAASIIRSLCEIVEKLPVTADGVPVVAGDRVWSASGQWYIIPGIIGNGIVALGGGILGDATRIGDCYSTREAAFAAAGKEKA